MSAERERIAGKVQEWYDKRAELEASGWGNTKEDLLLLLKAVLCTVDVEELKQKGYGPLHYLADAKKSKETRCSEVKGSRMLEGVKLLGECGLNLDAKLSSEDDEDEPGETALHLAAWRGHFDLVKGLVEAGADVNIKCDAGRTPLRLAASACHPMIVWYLLKHGAKWEGTYALHDAAWCGSPSSAKMLLKAGANVFEKNQDGDTAAQSCCRGKEGQGSKAGRAEALSILLKKGADVQVKNDNGHTLLHLAALFGNEQCIPILVGRGLQADARNNLLDTPLHLASWDGHLGCVKQLIRRGAPLDAVGVLGSTSLLFAVLNGFEEVVRELIRAGASVHVKDKNSITALHLAAALGSIKMAYLLVEGGAAVDALTDDGDSPLVSCMRPGEGKVARTLENFRTSPGEKEAREKVARFLLKMGSSSTDGKVMKVAGEAGFGDSVASFFREGMEERNVVKDRLHTVSTLYLSTMSGAEDEKADSIVRVRLVNTRSGEKGEKQYVLSIPLMERLAARVSGREEERVRISPGQASAAGILPNMLDPRKHGYKGVDEDDDGEEKGAGKGKKQMKRVELKYDGVDFTEEGFEAVVQFVTTGSVEELLTRRPREGGTEGGTTSSSSSGRRGGGGGGEAEGNDRGGKKKKRVKLFDDARAKQALQAAEFFCLEGMSREVKTLMGEYGFELEQNETEKEEEDGPSRKRSRADP